MYSQYQPIWSAVTLRSLHSIPPKKNSDQNFLVSHRGFPFRQLLKKKMQSLGDPAARGTRAAMCFFGAKSCVEVPSDQKVFF